MSLMGADKKRMVYFLIGCMGTRTGLTYLAFKSPKTAKKWAPLALVPAIGFAYLTFDSSRDRGGFGGKIWWKSLRPVHALLWAGFAIDARSGNDDAYLWLAGDTGLGFVAWALKHLAPPSA